VLEYRAGQVNKTGQGADDVAVHLGKGENGVSPS
jgi:hypothetical protein